MFAVRSRRSPAPETSSATGRPPWVQRCGIGSSCDCSPEDKLEGIRRDLDPAAGTGPAPARVQRHSDGGRLAHDLSHVLVGPPDDAYERQAAAVAAHVGGTVQPARHGAGTAGERSSPRSAAPGERSSPRSAAPGELDALVASPPAGSSLPTHVRSTVEPVLGADLSGVRVHADQASARVARSIGARAFTYGNHVFLGAGESGRDMSLMAHELTHTVQQGAAGPPIEAPTVQRWPSLDDVTNAISDAADSVGEAVDTVGEAIGNAVDTAGEALEDAADTAADIASDVADEVAAGASAVADVAEEAVDWLASAAGQALRSLAEAFGGVLELTADGIVLTLPQVCMDEPIIVSIPLPSLSEELMTPVFAVPLGPLALVGEIGVAGHIDPDAKVQIGPACIGPTRIVFDPLGASAEVSGRLTATAAASLGAEVRAGLRGALSLVGVVPVGGIPVPIELPLVALEGGLAGLLRGIAAGRLDVGGGLTFDLGGISGTGGGTLTLGLGADMFLGAYAQLDVLGTNICRIYWQPYAWHGDIGAVLPVDLSVSITPWSAPLFSVIVGDPVLTPLPFDQIPLALTREGFHDVCPILDAVCEVLRALDLLPSQNGGSWSWSGPYGPGPRLAGPLEVYQRDPAIVSGSTCRGACGPDCETCTATPVYTYTDPVTGEAWEYLNFQHCNSHAGCREHDAAFDWAATEHGEVGPGAEFMPWHMAANIECTCENLAGNCAAWIVGLPPYDLIMYFADSARRVPGGGGTRTTDCAHDFPGAPECVASFPDRDTVLDGWGLPKGLTNFRDCRIVLEIPGAPASGGPGPTRLWNCTATDLGSGQTLTIGLVERICCNPDGTSGSEWADPAVVVTAAMSEELILDLCERGLIPRVVCEPLEDEMIRRFGNRRRNLGLDPDKDPKTVLRPDDVPIFESFRRMYNRLDSWAIFIRTEHPDLVPDFDKAFPLEEQRRLWLADLKERAKTFKDEFRDLRDTDPGRARREYENAVLHGIQDKIEKMVRDIAIWFKGRTGSTETIPELIERVHAAGTELWRAAWRRAILQVNRVLSRLWPPAKTQILVWIGVQRSKRPDLDLTGPVGELDYIGSLATGFKGPPKQQIRFDPQKFDVDANLDAPPLAKYAIAVDRQVPDRGRIFGRNTTITPLIQFSDATHAELQARVTGYDPSPPPFDVALDAPELPVQTRERVATERLYRLRDTLDTTRYRQMLDEITSGGFLTADGRVRGDLTEAEFDRLKAIMDRYDPSPPTQRRPGP